MDELNAREKLATRVLDVMLKIISPHEHNFKNDEMIDYIIGLKK